MDSTVLKICAAGLMHDLGKAGTRMTFGIDQEYVERHENVFLPVYRGRYSHHHALYGAAFVEKNPSLFPREFTSGDWGEGDTFFNLVAGHHNPSTPLQWIVAVADRISSGWDRDIFEKEEDEIPVNDYLETRLLSLFEQLMAEEDSYLSVEDFAWHYSLAPLTPESLFPVERGNQEGKRENSGTRDYKELFEQFLSSLSGILHREDSVELWLEHFDSLMMVYMSTIPAARAGRVVPDVSLYDHSRVTAALASALYLFHKENDSLDETSIKDYETEKFLIIAGDLYGIQDFIFKGYGDTRRHRSKLLRGRSLYVSLLSELGSDLLCRKIGLHRISSILSAAGKFLIIAPNTERTRATVKEVEREINDWLFKVSLGETSLGIATIAAAPRDFADRNFQNLWDRISYEMERKKLSKLDLMRHGGVVEDYLDRFKSTLKSPLCPICGKRPSDEAVEGSEYIGAEAGSACRLCRDQIFLGTQVVKNDTVAVLSEGAEAGPESLRLMEPIYGAYQVAFLKGDTSYLARKGVLLAYWDIRSWGRGSLASRATLKLINGYVPVYSEEDRHDERILYCERSEGNKASSIEDINLGDPKTFAHISMKALNWQPDRGGWVGIDALGVLKADVDNLGILTNCGLRPERFTVSRLATLSRQLNAFFAFYLPYKLKENDKYKEVYTVFGGGDDLFLIGPWSIMLELAHELSNDFYRYCCRNPEIHLSAGITYCKPNIPLDAMATRAEEALENSKTGEKNKVTVFGETVRWKELQELFKIRDQLWEWYEEGIITRSMFYKLNELVDMAARERQVLAQNEIFLKDMHMSKWRALLAYFAERNIAKGYPKDKRSALVGRVAGALVKWLDSYGGSIRIPLWDILYNTR